MLVRAALNETKNKQKGHKNGEKGGLENRKNVAYMLHVVMSHKAELHVQVQQQLMQLQQQTVNSKQQTAATKS